MSNGSLLIVRLQLPWGNRIQLVSLGWAYSFARQSSFPPERERRCEDRLMAPVSNHTCMWQRKISPVAFLRSYANISPSPEDI